MKKMIKYAAVACAFAAFLYFLVAFYYMQLNANNWEPGARFFLADMWAFCFLVALVYYFTDEI